MGGWVQRWGWGWVDPTWVVVVQRRWWGVLGHAASFIFRALSVMSLCACVSQLVIHCPLSAPSVIVPGQWSVSATGSLGESSLTHSLTHSLARSLTFMTLPVISPRPLTLCQSTLAPSSDQLLEGDADADGAHFLQPMVALT